MYVTLCGWAALSTTSTPMNGGSPTLAKPVSLLLQKSSGMVPYFCRLRTIQEQLSTTSKFRRQPLELTWRSVDLGKRLCDGSAGECLRYGLEDLGLKCMIGLTYADHHASHRIMEKIGMAYEGNVHHYSRDLVQYCATKKESNDSEQL